MKHINGKTKIIGILGKPVSHSASPQMHNYVIQKLGLNYVYVPIETINNDLSKTIQSLKQLNYAGFNVTIPYKEAIIPFLDEIDDYANKLGAVNTVLNKDGKLFGYNTDGAGFMMSLAKEAAYDVNHKRVCIIGAGGAAKSISHALLEKNILSLAIINRNKDRALELYQNLKSIYEKPISYHCLLDPQINMVLSSSDLIINATSVGMTPHENMCPIRDVSWMKESQFFYDIVYNPEETMFLKQAYQKKALHLGGLGMLAGQGAIAFNLFTNQDLSFLLFREALDNTL